ncbi:hypothetical protein BDP27DRAFT_1386323 [Rhodocollybia butyracea]|uniref:Uncharacterized protein n=1 Tax=Rhodocollybia butyracea TaxID=206335 RepID=A0A9P5P762_9AGAR|nr:hypothetical protein BDP27DRAFT_1386323 [Rhodocollybia butyracea]
MAEALATVLKEEEWNEAVQPLRAALVKCRHVSFKIINSPTLLLPRWRETVAGTNFKDHILPRDVTTRWNSTYDMLAAFIEMKDVVCIYSFNILKDATLFFSSNSPNISAVIPAMDAIDEVFASGIIDSKELCAPLRHALGIGKRTLNKYYALTDNSDIYRVAMGKCLSITTCTPLLQIDVFLSSKLA